MLICLNAERGSVGVSEYALGEVTLEQMFIELVRRAESDTDNSPLAVLPPALIAQGPNAPYQVQTAANPLHSGFAQHETASVINQGCSNPSFTAD